MVERKIVIVKKLHYCSSLALKDSYCVETALL